MKKRNIKSKFPNPVVLTGLNGHLFADYDNGKFTYEYNGNFPILSKGILRVDIIKSLLEDKKRDNISFESSLMSVLKLVNMDQKSVKSVLKQLEDVVSDLKKLDEQLDSYKQ